MQISQGLGKKKKINNNNNDNKIICFIGKRKQEGKVGSMTGTR